MSPVVCERRRKNEAESMSPVNPLRYLVSVQFEGCGLYKPRKNSIECRLSKALDQGMTSVVPQAPQNQRGL